MDTITDFLKCIPALKRHLIIFRWYGVASSLVKTNECTLNTSYTCKIKDEKWECDFTTAIKDIRSSPFLKFHNKTAGLCEVIINDISQHQIHYVPSVLKGIYIMNKNNALAYINHKNADDDQSVCGLVDVNNVVVDTENCIKKVIR